MNIDFRRISIIFLPVLVVVFSFVESRGELEEITAMDAERRGVEIRERWPGERPVDETALAKAGVRRYEGKYVVLYTDCFESEEIKDFPKRFDRLVPKLCDYFALDAAHYDNFKVEAFLIDDFDKFKPSGAVRQVPDLRNGYAQRCRIWLRNQQSDYYRRHLFFHEGVHAFMGYAFGAWGPPWYREGTAELLATHRIDEKGDLVLGHFPTDRKELHHWGRIEIVRNDFLADRGKSPGEVFKLASEDYDENTAYGWSWAFAAFCENHPRYRSAFRKTAWKLDGAPSGVASRFTDLLRRGNRSKTTDSIDAPTGPDDTEIMLRFQRDWTDFLVYLDYGYDFQRTMIEYPEKNQNVPESGEVTIAVFADRGWHSDGLRLERGRTYRLTGTGRYRLGDKPELWFSEPNGVTFRYCRGLPVGTLLATLIPDVEERFLAEEGTPGLDFLKPRIVGLEDVWTAEVSGTLFFRINDFASELDDNRGNAAVRIKRLEKTSADTK